MLRQTLRADLLLLCTAVVWGFAFVAQRLGMAHVGPFTFNGVRFLLGAVVLVPLILILRRRERAAGVCDRDVPLGSSLWLGTVLFAGASLQQLGMVETSSGKAGFITGLYVVLVPVFGLLLRQRPGVGTWLGTALAAGGLYFLSISGVLRVATGDLLVLLGAGFWAVHVLWVGHLTNRVSASEAVRLASVQFSVCGVASLLVAAVVETPTWHGLQAATGAILYGGLISVGVGYTFQVLAQRDAKPAHAAILLSFEAVFASFGGFWLLQEHLAPRQLFGCALMLVGMVVSQVWR